MMGNTFCWDDDKNDFEEALGMKTEKLKDRKTRWKRARSKKDKEERNGGKPTGTCNWILKTTKTTNL
eukprot:5727298-Ditylum_brightwellii.AAC.1